MRDEEKTRPQLIKELRELRNRIALLSSDLGRGSSAAEEQLRESRRMLQTLMGNLPGMAYRCNNDREWTMEFISEGCFGLTGYHPSELIANRKLSYGQLITPDDRGKVWEEVQDALRRKKPFKLLYRIKTASGDEKWVWEKGSGYSLKKAT